MEGIGNTENHSRTSLVPNVFSRAHFHAIHSHITFLTEIQLCDLWLNLTAEEVRCLQRGAQKNKADHTCFI